MNWINHAELQKLVFRAQRTDCHEHIKEDLLEYLQIGCTGQEILTILQVLALPMYGDINNRNDFLQLTVSNWVDINMCSQTGFCLLTTALDSRIPCPLNFALYDVEFGDNQLHIDRLIEHEVKVDFTECTSTPVQSAIRRALNLAGLISIEDLPDVYRVVRILLDNGAFINGVANDQVNKYSADSSHLPLILPEAQR